MNYIAELNAFHRRMAADPLPPCAQMLWYKLMMLSNANGWRGSVFAARDYLMALCGLTNKWAFYRARDALVRGGYVGVGQGNRGKPAEYSVRSLCGEMGVNHPPAAAGTLFGERRQGRIPRFNESGREASFKP